MHVQAGGGIVADSEAGYEVRETEPRRGAVFGAIELACSQADWAEMRVLVIDNYDSFTFNLVQYLGELGAEPEVVRNDAADGGRAARARRRAADRLARAVHAGRGRRLHGGHPRVRRGGDAGARRLPRTPGAGGRVRRAAWCGASRCTARPPRSSTTAARSSPACDSPLTAGRYHSLVVDPDLPPELERSAHSGDTVMAIRHRELPAEGVQFHPESVLTGPGWRYCATSSPCPPAHSPADAQPDPHRSDRPPLPRRGAHGRRRPPPACAR